MCRKLKLAPSDVFLQKAPISFDASVQELFNSLACGGVLLLAAPGGEKDTEYLARLCKEQRVTCCSFVPSQLDVLLQARSSPVTAVSLLCRVPALHGNRCCAGAWDLSVQYAAPCPGWWRSIASSTSSAVYAAPAARASA